MENEHISICPICGSKRVVGIYDWALRYVEYYICEDCNKEVIPLVTPQEKE